MAKIQGGTLEYEVLLNTEKINGMLEETKRRIQGFSDATVAGGAKMETAYQAAGQQIKQGFETVGNAMQINQTAIAELQKRYNELGNAAAAAFQKGDYNKYNQITQQGGQLSVIQKEIGERQKIVAELEKSDAALVKYNKDLEDQKNKIDNASNANVRFRTQLLNVKNEMMQLEQAGKRNTAEYARLTEEAKRLANAMYSANSQIKTLTSVKGATLQGFVSGLSGVSGAFTAVNGAMGLFATKNEELQKTMMKVQSLMSITMGLQAISATLHQTSAFRLTVLTKVQAAYNAVLLSSGKALIKFGLSANAARGVVQLLYGTLTLGLAVAIPVVISLISKFISKQNEAKKAVAEFHKSVAEEASKPIVAFKKLQAEWTSVGDNFQKKMSILKDQKKMFEELGVSINGVIDAEKILTSPANVNAFISAQIAKARAKAKQSELEKLETEAAIAKQKLEDAWKKPTKRVYYADGSMGTVANPEIEKQDKALQTAKDKMSAAITDMGKYQKEAYEQAQKAIGGAITTYADGTVGALEQAKKREEEALESLKGDNAAYKAKLKDIENIQKQIDDITGKSKEKEKSKEKDPVIKELEEKKKAYQEYFKWVDAGMEKEARQEFAKLLESGATYKEYLEKRRQDTALTKEQIHQINNEIAADANKTVMGEFQKSLQEEMNNARSILDLIKLIETKREELEKSDDPLKVQKLEIITQEGENADKKAEDETRNLLKTYSDYLEEKINFELQYGERKAKLNEDLAKATTENERKIILAHLEGLEKDRKKYEKQTGNENYDKLLQEYRTFEQKKTDITNEFQQKRDSLNEKINSSDTPISEVPRLQAVLQQLEKDFQKEMSKLALDELQNSGTWEKLFGNLDDLTTKQIGELIAKIEEQKTQMGIELDPSSLKDILEKLEEAKEEIRSRNPFKALIDSVKEYGKATDDISKKKALVDTFKSVAKSVEMISGAMDSVVSGIKTMGIEMDETTEQIIGNINGMLDGVSKLADGIATKNPLSIIEGSVGLLSNVVSLFDAGSSRKNKRLQEEIQYYNTLVDVYGVLIDKQKALTESLSGKQAVDAYKEGLSMIAAQTTAAKASLENWFSSGASWKSHSNWYNYDREFSQILDRGKLLSMTGEQWTEWMKENAAQWARLPQEVKDYADAVMEAGEATEDLKTSMKEAVAGFSFDEAMNELSELVAQSDLTFEQISESFSGHMEKAILRMIQSRYINDKLSTWYDNFVKDMEDGILSDREAKQRQKEYEDIVNKANEAYKAAMKAAGISMENSVENVSSLSGAIKGASQESIDLLAGQTNAVRVNQVQSIEILRNQLLHLASIDMKIGVSNHHLESIDKKISTTHDILRSQGITD
jgi:PHD/YefM family antitoxin component YafN of YafNO toxin-antitoxin module